MILIPIALLLGGLGLVAFVWSLKSGQFEDLDGASMRILIDDEERDGNAPADADNAENSVETRDSRGN